MTEPRILTLDIETAPHDVHAWSLYDVNVGLNQIMRPGYILCFAAKWYGERGVLYHDVRGVDGPKTMRDALHRLLDEADAVITYNGRAFDLKHIRRELLLGGYEPPSPWIDIDLLTTVRSRFKFASSKLDYVVQQLDLGKKLQHTGHDLWVQCLDGDDTAWNLMARYCKRDVVLTERLYDRLRPWIPRHLNRNLWTDMSKPLCPYCGKDKLAKRGVSRTTNGIYQRYQCSGCGAWSQDSRRIDGTTVKAAG